MSINEEKIDLNKEINFFESTDNETTLTENKEEMTDEIPTAQEQKNLIKPLLIDMKIIEDEFYYLIESKWMKKWKEYVGYNSYNNSNSNVEPPNEIDNTPLISPTNTETNEEDIELKEFLMENFEYDLISAPIWNKLYSWYKGGPSIKRKAIKTYFREIVEIYPLRFNLILPNKEVKQIKINKNKRVGDIVKMAAEILKKPEEEITIFSTYFEKKEYSELNNNDPFEYTLSDRDYLIVKDKETREKEEKEKEDSYSSTYRSSLYSDNYSSSSSSSSSSSTLSGVKKSGKNKENSYTSYYSSSNTPGLCGIRNLGNTCFMNSALQCMFHCSKEMRNYFIKGEYKNEVNSKNPLGTGGKLVKQFAKLFKEVWSGDNSTLAPYEFKKCIEEIAPRFIGYQQQDAAELLNYMLDGIHEDLNRVKEKPMVPKRECANTNLLEAANLSWDDLKKRNNSVIVDKWMGLFKSTLRCPNKECGNVSVVFDPFMSVPLPLEDVSSKELTLSFFSYLSSPSIFHFSVPIAGSIKDLKKMIAKETKGEIEDIHVVEIYGGKIYKHFTDKDSLSEIQSNDKLVSYLFSPLPPLSPLSDLIFLPLYSFVTVPSSRSSFSASTFKDAEDRMVGVPLLLRLSRTKTTSSFLFSQIFHFFSPFFNLSSSSSNNEENDNNNEKNNNENNNYNNTINNTNNDNNNTTINNTNNENNENDENNENNIDNNIDNNDNNIGNNTTSDKKNIVGERGKGGRGGEKGKRNYLKYFTVEHVAENKERREIYEIGDTPVHLKNGMLVVYWEYKFYKNNFIINSSERNFSTFDLRSTKKESNDLLDCFSLFSKPEILSENDAWYCPKCKKHQQASKEFSLWSLPQFLVIQLKRFSANGNYRDKLTKKINFPLKGLDLTEQVDGPKDKKLVYNLFGVSNHMGGLGGGHYVANCLVGEQWYEFDDSHVSKVSHSSIVDKSAYILFYELDNKEEKKEEEEEEEEEKEGKEDIFGKRFLKDEGMSDDELVGEEDS